MKRFRTALAVSLLTLGGLAGCNDYNTSIQYSTGATITSISPSALPAGTPSGTLPACPAPNQNQSCFTLYVVGSGLNGFQSTTVVEWNGQKLPTTYLDGTNLSAQVPYSFVAKPGTAFVKTLTPQSGTGQNGLSNTVSFFIYAAPNPVPTLSSVSPVSAPVCASNCANVAITLTGSNFLPPSQNGGSSVTYTGIATSNIETAIAVTSITSTEIKAAVPGAYLNCPDNAKINVINPPSAICLVNCPNLGGGDTNVPSPNFQITGTGASSCAAPNPAAASLAVAEETPAVSQDGRYVAYASSQDGISQILLRDTCLGAAKDCTASTRTVSVAADGAVGNEDSHNAVMSSDGRYVAFSSVATNLVENAPPGRQVYLHDTCNGVQTSCKPSTLLISTDEEGKLTGTEAILPSISTSGRFVAFLAITPSHAVN